MGIVVVIALLIIVVIFGFMSMGQSYATAQQAQAQIEVARAAQINASGNLVTIVSMTLGILVVVLLASAVLFWILKRSNERARRNDRPETSLPRVPAQPQIDVAQVTQLATLRILMSLLESGQKDIPSLPAPTDAERVDEAFPWLR